MQNDSEQWVEAGQVNSENLFSGAFGAIYASLLRQLASGEIRDSKEAGKRLIQALDNLYSGKNVF